MDHQYAVLHHLAEQYLLEELSPEQRDEFEAHFFECEECAAELRVTSAFLQSAREELRKPRLSGISQGPALVPPGAIPSDSRRSNLIHWRPALALAALAACMMVVVYQNVVTVPRLRNEVASLETPAVLPSISLAGGNSRGGGVPSATRNGVHSILLQVDIPSQQRFASYTCLLYSPGHQLLWTMQVSAQEAKDTVIIRAPLPGDDGGTYSLNVRGNQVEESSTGAPGVDLASYPFTINAGDAGGPHQDKSQTE